MPGFATGADIIESATCESYGSRENGRGPPASSLRGRGTEVLLYFYVATPSSKNLRGDNAVSSFIR